MYPTSTTLHRATVLAGSEEISFVCTGEKEKEKEKKTETKRGKGKGGGELLKADFECETMDEREVIVLLKVKNSQRRATARL